MSQLSTLYIIFRRPQCSNLGPGVIVLTDFFVLCLVPTVICLDSTSNYAKTAAFHILTGSLFTDDAVI